MPPKDRSAGQTEALPPPSGRGRGRGKGCGRKGGDSGRGGGSAVGSDAAKRLAEMDDRSIEAESNIEILRAQRAAARRGGAIVRDTIRENEGVDEEDPSISIDAGIRIEPFNMRREMAEGHFDEGGFYIFNKEEEKEVTDAWLDTVDQAERTASFKREEAAKRAGMTTASRISALSRNLKEGGREEDEKEEEEEEEDEDQEEQKPQERLEEEPKVTQPLEVYVAQPKDLADDIDTLEALIGELLPLETPSEALARFAKGGRGNIYSQNPLLKLRSRMRKARATNVCIPQQVQASAPEQADLSKQRKRKFNEFGYDDVINISSCPALDTKPQTPNSSSEGGGSAGSKSVVANVEAVAAAAEKQAAKDKADAEAAAAFAAEMKMTKHILHMGIDADGHAGPEATAILNLNADDASGTRAASKEAEGTVGEVKPDTHLTPATRKRASEPTSEELERKNNIERLTDLCDTLLQKGVNVYDSTRELLAIEVRERKGEKLIVDKSQEEVAGGALASNAPHDPDKSAGSGVSQEGSASERASVGDVGSGTASADVATSPIDSSAHPPVVLYDNRRCANTDVAVVDADKFEAVAALLDHRLFWQFRWAATPGQTHGPFDSVTMQGWITQGCFAEERPAEIRQCDVNNEPLEQCWHRWNTVDFELYL
mmetsp:Transcript_138113/g.344870  ORF Transcript_138113/g.344870 Transcript_138113/m.344870 type:complete len:658 (-) Transcript_138113:152-2125(-)